MKRYLHLSFIFFLSLLFTGCATTRPPTLNADLTHETWMQRVDTRPDAWARGADRWFLNGSPNNTELENRHAPYGEAVSTMMVRVPAFTRVQSNGDFQVQIFGTYGPPSVYVYGPNEGVRDTLIHVHGDTLFIDQVKRASYTMHRVIIRVGVSDLRGVTQLGRGCIEGVQLRSSGLSILQAGSGNIYLAGNLNVHCITNAGMGSVNVFGANTHTLTIKTNRTGNVNVSGNVGVRQIQHLGSNNINIIGANSGNLGIYTDGSGKIGISGCVGVCKITAKHDTCVYITQVNTGTLYTYLYDRARVGVAGIANRLYVDAYGSSRFEGRYLCTQAAFVRAYNQAHINVTSQKLFASAIQDASVYFYGTPNALSQFVSGNGTIIPIWYENMTVCPIVELMPRLRPQHVPVRHSYKHSYKGEDYQSPRAAWMKRR
jgi:hypothetical protein